jgi:hypothetical protein
MLCFAAAAQEQATACTANSSDIWLDTAAMHKLQHGTDMPNITATERSRITKRLAYYCGRTTTS